MKIQEEPTIYDFGLVRLCPSPRNCTEVRLFLLPTTIKSRSRRFQCLTDVSPTAGTRSGLSPETLTSAGIARPLHPLKRVYDPTPPLVVFSLLQFSTSFYFR